jgi:hypothetical protein
MKIFDHRKRVVPLVLPLILAVGERRLVPVDLPLDDHIEHFFARNNET